MPLSMAKQRRWASIFSNGSDRVVLTIQNDGKPFPDLNSKSTGMGLRIMNYRANLINASLEIKGTGAHGTRVICSFPISQEKVQVVLNHHQLDAINELPMPSLRPATTLPGSACRLFFSRPPWPP